MRLRAFILAALLLIPTAVCAHEYKVGTLVIEHPWARATMPGAKVAGGFVEITNNGTEAERLLSVSTPVSQVTQIHSMSMENNVMKMAELPDGLEIKPGETLVLKPHSFHIMFMGLKEPLQENIQFDAEFTFAKAGKVSVEFMVEAQASQGKHH